MTVFYADNIPLHDSAIVQIKERQKRRGRKETVYRKEKHKEKEQEIEN